jgi:hypothetical protein
MERHLFPSEMRLEEAQIIAFGNDQGESIPGVIRQIGADRVLVDFNLSSIGSAFSPWKARTKILPTHPRGFSAVVYLYIEISERAHNRHSAPLLTTFGI